MSGERASLRAVFEEGAERSRAALDGDQPVAAREWAEAAEAAAGALERLTELETAALRQRVFEHAAGNGVALAAAVDERYGVGGSA